MDIELENSSRVARYRWLHNFITIIFVCSSCNVTQTIHWHSEHIFAGQGGHHKWKYGQNHKKYRRSTGNFPQMPVYTGIPVFIRATCKQCIWTLCRVFFGETVVSAATDVKAGDGGADQQNSADCLQKVQQWEVPLCCKIACAGFSLCEKFGQPGKGELDVCACAMCIYQIRAASGFSENISTPKFP